VPAPASASAAASPAPTASATDTTPVADNRGRLTIPAERGGHRVWFDKKIIGESPGSFDVPCGWHSVQVGSAGTVQKLNVACGAETELH
jgi:hypothetical protein